MDLFARPYAAFLHWLSYTGDQITDASFWWGIVTAVGLVAATVIFPAFRGAISPATTFVSRLGNGYYYYYLRSYPDIISASAHILIAEPGGRQRFLIDTILSERSLMVVMWNPYKAYLLRQTAGFADPADPLIRLNPYGPKRRFRLFRRRPPRAVEIGKMRRTIIRRYRSMYRPLVSSIAEHYTNNNSIRASRGEHMQVMKMVIAKTYMGRNEKHHRIHLMHEWQFAQWPDECPDLARESYRERHELTVWLRRMYRRYPWRFDFVYDFVPKDLVPDGFSRWAQTHAETTPEE